MSKCEIWHGDALELIPKIDRPVNCIVTDPPYGVDFVSRRGTTPEGKAKAYTIANDLDVDGAGKLFLDVMSALLPKTTDQAELYVFTRWDIVGDWIAIVNALVIFGFQYKMLLIWDKGIPGMGDIDSNWGCGHELILYLKKGRRDIPYRRSGIIAVDKVHAGHLIHPMEKPVALLEKLIEMSTDPGDLVVDPFCGSGSTIHAAQNLGRDGIGIDLDAEEKFIHNSRARLQQTGLF